MFPETLRSASRKTERLFQAQSVSHRTDQTSLVSKRTPRDFPSCLFLYPVPSAAARTAPNGVKERASFCLVFRSLNATSSYRVFSMGYRRAKSTQGNTNFQKRFFWQLRWLGTVLGRTKCADFFVKTYCLWHKQLENEIILGGHRAPFFRKWVRTLLFSTFLSMG